MRNNYHPMEWKEFKAMDWNSQNEYIWFLRTEFGATCTAMANMFGVTQPTVSEYCKTQNFNCKFNKVIQMTKDEANRFKEFCKPMRPDIEIKYGRTKSVSDEWELFKEANLKTQKKFISQMYRVGHTQLNISEMFGITDSALNNYLRRNDMRRINNRYSRKKTNKPVPLFSEWLKDRTNELNSSNVVAIQEVMDLSSGMDSNQKVIQMKKDSETKWVCASRELPKEEGVYVCVVITGVSGRMTKNKKLVMFDGTNWKMKGTEIITHWLTIPEFPEQVAI